MEDKPTHPPAPVTVRPKMHHIWDGIAFRSVTPEEAAQLVAEDKAQDLSLKFISGTEMKRRSEFTGYKTKPARPATVEKVEDEVPSGKPEPEPLKHWLSYRSLVAADIGKPANKVTKAEVDVWLVQKGHVSG